MSPLTTRRQQAAKCRARENYADVFSAVTGMKVGQATCRAEREGVWQRAMNIGSAGREEDDWIPYRSMGRNALEYVSRRTIRHSIVEARTLKDMACRWKIIDSKYSRTCQVGGRRLSRAAGRRAAATPQKMKSLSCKDEKMLAMLQTDRRG
jgi:hypothetical protein